VARLILDSGVLVVRVRSRLDLGVMTGEDGVALQAVAVAEYLTGCKVTSRSPTSTPCRSWCHRGVYLPC